MRINRINILQYAPKLKNEQNPIKERVSFTSNPTMRAFDPQAEIIAEENYRNELISAHTTTKKDEEGNPVLDRRGNTIRVVTPEIKEAMDNSVFLFENPRGETIKGTIKDAILFYAIEDETMSNIPCRGLFHGTSRENMEKILTQGPDVTLSSRTAFGPGMYFAFTEGDAMDYSSTKLMADIEPTRRKDGTYGKFVRFNTDFYEKIKGPGIAKISKLTGIKATSEDFGPGVPYYVSRVKMEVPGKIFDDYCRDVIVNELGIDAACGRSHRYHSCAVAFNPDCIHNIRKY